MLSESFDIPIIGNLLREVCIKSEGNPGKMLNLIVQNPLRRKINVIISCNEINTLICIDIILQDIHEKVFDTLVCSGTWKIEVMEKPDHDALLREAGRVC